ncbi:hypothetical protein GALL_59470 [mine drainage metagenome]|uniref:Uncharacterized protein n=1 Tax=mine drainage metagenome TaxID=410659 RepID=A0A1J5T9E9_9ZZZZ
MKHLLTISFSLFIFCTAATSQAKIDSSAKPEESTFYDGIPNIVFTPGLVIKTRSGHYYEITDKTKLKNMMANPSVTVYKFGKRKFQLVIQGIEIPIEANRIQEVIESNINGDFKGWEGATSFNLVNGETWVQDEFGSLFANLYRPKVFIYRTSDGTYKMRVEGIKEVITVRRK